MSTINLQLPESIVALINTPERKRGAEEAVIKILSPLQLRQGQAVMPDLVITIIIEGSDTITIEVPDTIASRPTMPRIIEKVKYAIIAEATKMIGIDWNFILQSNISLLFLQSLMMEKNRQKIISDLLAEFDLKYEKLSPVNYGTSVMAAYPLFVYLLNGKAPLNELRALAGR